MSVSNGFDDFYAIIPAGGTGTRLWPLSRESRPKFLYDLLNSGSTLIQSTFDRLAAIAGIDHVSVSTGRAHVDAIREQIPVLAADHIFAEPLPRDSTAAIALATAVLSRRHGDQIIVGSFAADHVIRGTAAFVEAVREAVETARAGYIATIGIAASRPSTAFGYIHEGESIADRVPGAPRAHVVEQFVEKPDAATAQAYLSTGEYRWNAGMFVMRADVLLNHLHEYKPALAAAIDEIADAIIEDDRDYMETLEAARTAAAESAQSSGTAEPVKIVETVDIDYADFHAHCDEAMERWWPGIEKIAFDYAVAEPLSLAGGVAVIPGDFGWDDIGDFNSLAALLPSVNERNLKVLGDVDQVVSIESAGDVVVPKSGRMIALLDVDDMVVVDTPDALLIAPRARSQDVKKIVRHLADEGYEDVL
ncbi:mannose-1-phosphate guanylyltransferase [Bifidobacterium magnum]|uniref:Mannose-1-phosphate guanylyltransferase n=1 Tax=Bifidobacterium magnum TaxID=1692 RepID=A0A087BB27_9BIFI|nr:mannose-1-phosphate guanylyltransferase [Bifidobacterium magnum]KFI68227.1 Mannose-1-phosphate guanylyltransferase [Bifidobacterium magnum]